MRLCRTELPAVASIFAMFHFLWPPGQTATCEELRCLHGNPCQESVDGNNVTWGVCLCSGQWAGPRCGNLIRLKPQHVTSSSATFAVEMTAPRLDPTGPSSPSPLPSPSSAMSLVASWEEVGHSAKLNYTLVYWRRNDTITSQEGGSSGMSGEVTCVLHHQRESREVTVRGMVPATLYTVCVENGFLDSCLLASFSDPTFPRSMGSIPSLAQFVASRKDVTFSSWPTNCVTILTPAFEPDPDSLTMSASLTGVAAVAIVVLGALVLVLGVILLRRHSLPLHLFLDGVCLRRCACCTCRHRAEGKEADDAISRPINRYAFVPPQSSGSGFSTAGAVTDFMNNGLFRMERRKCRTLAEVFGRKGKQKRPCSLSYARASMLLLPPSSRPQQELFCVEEASPFHGGEAELLAELNMHEGGKGSAGAAWDQQVAHPLHAIYHRRSKGHKLSRKRRGYVAYSARQDSNIRLTTVLELPLDDIDTAHLATADAKVAITV